MTKNIDKEIEEKNLQNKYQANHSKPDQPAISIGLNIVVLLATLIFPIIGIAMGFTYIRKGHPSTIQAGKIWLITGTIALIIQIILININRPN